MRAVGYFIVGYFVLSIGATGLFVGSATGVLLSLAAAGAMVWLIRSYRAGKEPRPPALPAPVDLRPAVGRLGRRAAELVERLPENPLDNRSFVDASYALLNEPAEQQALADEYEGWRLRLERGRRHVEQLEADAAANAASPDEVAALGRELDALAADLDGLDDRARSGERIDDVAAREMSAAEETLLDATDALSRAPAAIGEHLGHVLGAARVALAEAQRLAAAQRPVSAARKASAARDGAEQVIAAVQDALAAPGRLDRQRAELRAARAELDRSLEQIRDGVALAELRTAPSALVEVRAAHDRARQLAEDADEHAAELEERLAAAGEATTLAESALERLAELADATVRARDELDDAERALERTRAEVEADATHRARRAATIDVLDRARRQVDAARLELARERPDWFRARHLAATAAEVARTAARAAHAGNGVAPATTEEATTVAAARERAVRARDEAVADALVSSRGLSLTDGARAAVSAFDRARAAEDALGEAPEAELARTRAAAVAAYLRAERLALDALAGAAPITGSRAAPRGRSSR